MSTSLALTLKTVQLAVLVGEKWKLWSPNVFPAAAWRVFWYINIINNNMLSVAFWGS